MSLLAEQLAWQSRGACKKDPELWSNPETADEAVHQCLSHCRVLTECREWAAGHDWHAVVVAGVHWGTPHNRGTPVIEHREQLCSECVGPDECQVCGARLVGRPPRAKTCSSECGKVLAARRQRAKDRNRRARQRRELVSV